MQYFVRAASLIQTRRMMDTEEIAQGCKRGDPATQAALFRRFRPDVWHVVSRYVTDASRVEDLLHDTFLLAFTHIGQLRDDARLEAWLLRLARNVALLYLRRKRSDDTLSLDDAQSLLAEDSDAADAAPPTLDELLGLVEQLPEGYRNVFKLYVLDGLPHDEIARLLRISPHSSSSQLLRARRLLQRRLRARRWPLLPGLLLLAPASREVHRLTLLPVSGNPVKEPADGPRSATMACRTARSQPGRQPDTLPPPAAAGQPPVPTTAAVPPAPMPPADTFPRRDGRPPFPERRPTDRTPAFTGDPLLATVPRWQFSVSVNGLSASRATQPRPFTGPGIASQQPVTDWETLYALSQTDAADSILSPALAAIAAQNSGPIVEKEHHRPAFSVALGLRHSWRGGWGVSGNIGYLRLTSDFTLGESAYVRRTQRLYYLGLSLTADCDCYTSPSGRLRLSVSAGAGLYIPLRGTSVTAYVVDQLQADSAAVRLHARPQVFLSGSIGLEYRFTPHLSLVLSPSVRYCPDNGEPLRTHFQARPVTFSAPFALRWSF